LLHLWHIWVLFCDYASIEKSHSLYLHSQLTDPRYTNHPITVVLVTCKYKSFMTYEAGSVVKTFPSQLWYYKTSNTGAINYLNQHLSKRYVSQRNEMEEMSQDADSSDGDI
jgi:hypothetical protein